VRGEVLVIAAAAALGFAAEPAFAAPPPDTSAPATAITGHPPAKTKKRSATFTFKATEPATFTCRLDATAATSCASPFTLSHLKRGRHTFTVAAVDTADNVDATPATYSWKVKRKHRR
jgi:hypothetical protein